MEDQPTIKYKDVVITYNEKRDRWEFNLRGRERSSETLLKAKEAIDKPPPKNEKPFARFEAWRKEHWHGWLQVTVTSLIGNRFEGEKPVECWGAYKRLIS